MAKKIWTPAARKAFALKMKRARAAKRRVKNPAKLERCVKAVKKRKVRNAYAVCKAVFKRKKRVRRRNAKGYAMRSGHYLVAVRGKTRLYYDGQNFSHKGSARLYPSIGAAKAIGKGLVRHYPVLRAYRLYVGHT